MAISILFPLVILSKEFTTERFSQLAEWDTYSNIGDPMAASGSSGTTKEAARVRAQRAGQGQGPGPRPQAASFVVPGDPEAATGSPVFEYGFQVANLENRSVVTAYTKILKRLQNRHGHVSLSPSLCVHMHAADTC